MYPVGIWALVPSDSDQELESLASQVAERTLEEEDDQQVVGLSRDLIEQRAKIHPLDPFRSGVFRWDRRRAIHAPGGLNLLSSRRRVQTY